MLLPVELKENFLPFVRRCSAFRILIESQSFYCLAEGFFSFFFSLLFYYSDYQMSAVDAVAASAATAASAAANYYRYRRPERKGEKKRESVAKFLIDANVAAAWRIFA